MKVLSSILIFFFLLLSGGYGDTPDERGPKFKKKSNPVDVAKQNRWAVIVGINQYADDAIGNLSACVADVTSVYNMLTDPQTGGFDKSQVKILTDSQSLKPTYREVWKALSVASEMAAGGTLLFYFAGHGIESNGKSYLLPNDADMVILEQTAIRLSDVRQLLEKSKANAKILILDACHSGGDTATRGTDFQMGEEYERLVFQEAAGMVTLSSASKSQVAYEDNGHGVFTRFLLEGLGGVADADGDGRITVTEANRYVTYGVKKWAFERGKKQTPIQSGWLSGDIVLTTKNPEDWTQTGIVDPPEPFIDQSILPKVSRNIVERLGIEMIPIAAGHFIMGSNSYDDEKPQRTIYLDDYDISKYEMTHAQYKRFVDANPKWQKANVTAESYLSDWKDNTYSEGKATHPVAYISWYAATAFCEWLSQETGDTYRLPTEAEWEKAARGHDGRTYPWGNQPPSSDLANWENIVGSTTRVGKYPKGSSPLGCMDMAGNLMEWCYDWYTPNYQAHSDRNPAGPDSGDSKVVRGGSFYLDNPMFFRCTARLPVEPESANPGTGFRIVKVVK